MVRSTYDFTVGGFSSLEVSSRVVISYSIFESVWFWGFVISDWLSWMICWSWSVVWGWSVVGLGLVGMELEVQLGWQQRKLQ